MSTLLRLDSSPMDAHSMSRKLSHAFAERWQALHPRGHIIVRDLTQSQIAPVTADWVAAAYTPEGARTPELVAELSLSDAFIAELEAADEYVFGVPMHNFGIPAVLKLWLDKVARVGKTFAYVNDQPTGLLVGKKATIIIASGGMYEPGSATASFDFIEPYLRVVLSFLGITEQTYIRAGGTSVLRDGSVSPTEFLQPHLETITGLMPTT